MLMNNIRDYKFGFIYDLKCNQNTIKNMIHCDSHFTEKNAN